MLTVFVFFYDSVECHTPRYNRIRWIVGTFAFLFAFGIPALFAYLVFHFKPHAQAGDKVVKSALGWMYLPFKDGSEWWLVLELLRILLLTSAVGWVATTCWMKILGAQLMALAFWVIFLAVRPYRSRVHFLGQSFAMVVPIIVTAWAEAGGWERNSLLASIGEESAQHADGELSYDAYAVVALHGLLLAPPILSALFNVFASLHVWRIHRQRLSRRLSDAKGEARARDANNGGSSSSSSSGGASWSSWSSITADEDDTSRGRTGRRTRRPDGPRATGASGGGAVAPHVGHGGLAGMMHRHATGLDRFRQGAHRVMAVRRMARGPPPPGYKGKKKKDMAKKKKKKDKNKIKSSSTTTSSLRRKKTLKKVFTQIDADHSGHVDFHEFITALLTDDDAEVDVDAARRLFDLVDEDHSGTIEKKEMLHALRHNEEAAALAEKFKHLHDMLDAAATSRSKSKLRREKTKLKRKTSSRPSRRGRRATAQASHAQDWRVKSATLGVKKQILESGVLEQVKLFRDCKITAEGFHTMADNMEQEEIAKGQPICTEGDQGDKLYVIASGLASVMKGTRVVSTLGPGKVFGEIALMQEDCKRTASVVAKSDVVLLTLSRDRFHEVMDDAVGAATAGDGEGRASQRGGHHAARAHTERNLLKDERRKSKKSNRLKRKKSTGGRRRRKSRVGPRTNTQQVLGGGGQRRQSDLKPVTEQYKDEDGVLRLRTVGLSRVVKLKTWAGRARRRVHDDHAR